MQHVQEQSEGQGEETEEEVLELTDMVMEPPAEAKPIVSEPVEDTTAQSFAHLTRMMIAGYDGADNTLEALVRELLRPLLQGWLDEHLPEIVKEAVEKEVARISRKR